ncbi:esterase-like activity of phytase family protein [Stappia stellulata]|uniref:esterase-like activity of phytase family protein n=1 Tax=Stappia stellulata TaxID=71235 RepID=UPI000409BFE4|nr:esterase-like activity of phytase family protein [Stappia stellulata]
MAFARCRWPRCLAALPVLIALAVAPAVAADGRKQIGIVPVDVQVKQIARFSKAAGDDRASDRLTFIGGLELLPGNRHMGGLSGLVVTGEGRELLAVADNGLWFQARVVSDPAGRPLAVEDARIAPMLGPDGRPLADSGRGDSEGVTLRLGAQGAELLVSTERRPHVYAYPFPLDPDARGRDIALPPGIRKLRHNKGMEAIAAANSGPLAGTLVIIGERGATFADDLPGFLIGGADPGEFTVARQDAYDATDAAFLPDGDLLLLERRFTLRHGLGMRLRLFAADELRPGRRAVGEVLLEAGYTDQIDNMEGLAVHETAQGETILTLISDDNRSILQRNLLLRFRLEP